MPTFFTIDSLTEKQKANWDFAIAEYVRIQEQNAEREFQTLSAKDKAFCEGEGAKTDDEIREKVRLLSNLTGNSPGHSKSALFYRLLEGKPALESPPPTSYSYPWYSVIEVPGAHRVTLGGCMSMGAMMGGTGGAKGDFGVVINQCRWAATGHNAAAKKLLELDKQLKQSSITDPADKFSRINYWSESFLEEVKSTYLQGPEFTVKYGEWTEYRLFCGPNDDAMDCSKSARNYAKKQMKGNPDSLKRVGSVFELDMLYLNARIGKTLSMGVSPQKRIEDGEARYKQLVESNSGNSLEATVIRQSLAQQLKTLQGEMSEFEANPHGGDWVELFMDDWLLEKL